MTTPSRTSACSVGLTRIAPSSRAAFSLVKLLVVMVILTIVIALALPGLAGTRKHADAVRCGVNLRQVGLLATNQYQDTLVPLSIQLALIKPEPQMSHSTGGGMFTLGCGGCMPAPPLPGPAPDPDPGASGSPAAPDPGSDPQPAAAAPESSAMTDPGLEGCPQADPNPAYAVDPQNESPFRSYGVYRANLGVAYDAGGEWLFADASFSDITATEDLAAHRHRGKVNVYFKDGHVELVSPDQVPFDER